MNNQATQTLLLDFTMGDRLYRSLRITGISNAEMAEELGVSRNTIGNWIADRTPIRDGFLKLWALRTGIPYVELRYGVPTADGPDGGLEVDTMDYGAGLSRNVINFPTLPAEVTFGEEYPLPTAA